MSLQLAELLSHQDFGLELLTTSLDEAAARPIAGAHAIETSDPGRWVDPDWVILTDGIVLHEAHAQRQFIRRAVAANLCAVGLTLGIHFASPPQELLAEADHLGMPLFTVPESIAFRNIIRFVDQHLLSDDLRQFQRLLSGQASLIERAHDLLDDEMPLVQRLSEILSATVSVLGLNGVVRYSTPTRSAPPVIGAGVLPTAERSDTPNGVFIVPIKVTGTSPEWLHIQWPSAHVITRTERELIRTVCALLAILRRTSAAAAADSARRQSELVKRLVSPAHGEVEGDIESELSLYGLTISDGLRLVIAASHDDNAVTAKDRDIPHVLAAQHAPQVHALWATLAPYGSVAVCTDRTWESVANATRERRRAIGVSRIFYHVSEGRLAAQQARIAARVHLSSPEHVGYVCADTLGLSLQLAMQIDVSVAGNLAESTIAPLAEHPDLLRTFSIWLQEGRDVGKSAERLFVHPNSVRYRLRRMEELLGRSLTDAETLSDLHIATMILDF